MKKVLSVFVVVLIITACGNMPFESIESILGGNQNTNSRYIDIPEGWQIEREGDYARLEWNPNFTIEERGLSISFIGSDGIPVVLKKNSESFNLYIDRPSATFEKNSITLEMKGLTLVFIKNIEEN